VENYGDKELNLPRLQSGVILFGMLDYRAHKLLWLMTLPFWLTTRLLYFVTIFVAIIIAQSTSYGTLIKIFIANLVCQGILLVLKIIISIIGRILQGFFFFFVDVVPAHGANAEEAREIALTGRLFELNKKLENEIQNWTLDDTDEYARLMNWRVRLLGAFRRRLYKVVPELQRIYDESGKQPRELGMAGVDEVAAKLGLRPSWIERAINSPSSYNSLLAIAIISIVIARDIHL